MKKRATFTELVRIMARLRAPGGCPWDREQTHESLLKYIHEEAAEVSHAVKNGDMNNLKEELGDVLLQVLFHSDIAREEGDFDIHEVMATLKKKLVSRHPHVFHKDRKRKKLTADDVVRRWHVIKRREKARRKSR